jgi:DNA-binding PadR family transcriptional regulator
MPSHFYNQAADMTLDMVLETERQRALEDMLQAERDLRLASEALVRDLRQVLLETAMRMDGVRLEEMRRADPSALARWTAEDWRRFMSAIPIPRWGESRDREQQWLREKRELLQQIEALRLAARRESSTVTPSTVHGPSSEDSTVHTPPSTVHTPPYMTPPFTVMVERTSDVLRNAPASPPARFSRLDGGSRTGGDRRRVFPRYWATLYLVGHFGLAAIMEIEHILAAVFGMSPGSGSLRRAIEDLEERGFLHVELLSLSAPKSALKTARLTADGTELYRSVFDEEPSQTDWERLIQWHEGETYTEHTMAVLAFTMHARRRGWSSRVMPDVDGPARPDCQVSSEQGSFYVEVELSQKENAAKWRNLAELNNGATALCAGTTRDRARLIGDCKLLNLHGVATDIETLIQTRFKLAADTPLWSETW